VICSWDSDFMVLVVALGMCFGFGLCERQTENYSLYNFV
jgi:hypothetical protein